MAYVKSPPPDRNTKAPRVKLSPGACDTHFHISVPFSDVLPFVHQLVGLAPNRLLWGSDWPHPNHFNPMPNDADLLDLMIDWVPDAKVLNLIMAGNPRELSGHR